jgi:hypothetical protein
MKLKLIKKIHAEKIVDIIINIYDGDTIISSKNYYNAKYQSTHSARLVIDEILESKNEKRNEDFKSIKSEIFSLIKNKIKNKS